jgi:nucleotide-binding universal stress UspA family protein
MSNSDRIVVGVDDCLNSQAALRWAAEQARATGATLHAVHAWNFSVYPHTLVQPQIAIAREDARRRLDAAVAAALEDAPGVLVVKEAICGTPGDVLHDVGVGARMLVLGSRRHGGLAGALLGSVGRHLTTHAPCPVVVVPAPTVAQPPRQRISAAEVPTALL